MNKNQCKTYLQASESITTTQNPLRFFSKWFFISLILVLLGLISASAQNHHPSHQYLLGLLSSLLQNIGVAIFVANIFSFILGTNEFLDFIRDRLISLVLSKDFITKLSQDEQRRLLGLVLKPSRHISNIYSGINDYFNQYIEESMRLFDTCYRGHIVLDALASVGDDGRLKVVFDIDYMIYKVGDRFEKLRLGLEDSSFEHIRTIVRAQGGIEKEIPKEAFIEITEINDPTIKKLSEAEIPEEFNKFSQINISRRVVEYGNDHWQVFSYKTIKACDRLTVILRCSDGLVIRNCGTYGVEDKFSIEKEERAIKIVYNDWLSPGFGVNILIAKEGFHQPQ